MSKNMSSLKKFEIWFPIVITILANVVMLTAWAVNIKGGQDLITQKLDFIEEKILANSSRVDTVVASLNKVESHVCRIDTLHNISCIGTGN